MTLLRRLLANARRFGRDRSAIAAVEFSLILPMMVVLYLGGFEVSEAVTINRKVTHATSSLGDLVAQSNSVTTADITNILDAVAAVMNPYPTTAMTMVVSGVTINAAGVATVTWSDARNGPAHTAGAPFVLPDGVRQPSTFLVVAEVSYRYEPRLGRIITGPIDLTEEFYLRPRLGTTVTRR